ncbi:hypothetical protein [Actibacterium mucosum]|uniref:hypothetical protein n=1 Tax=Actibacterium mucosum TaxID=1087332 RepID=UPI0012688832|nr:hypothetical protein [Actibacterium mucosum]
MALLTGGLWALPASAQDKYQVIVGEILVGAYIADRCTAFERVGGPGDQAYVIAASNIAAKEKGIGRNPVRKRIFYEKNENLAAIGQWMLSQLDLSLDDVAGLCRYGKKVIGPEHRIGRYLVAN